VQSGVRGSDRFTGEEVGGSVEALDLVAGREGSLEQQGAHDIIGGVNHMLSRSGGEV
jgi:hypothetical protein